VKQLDLSVDKIPDDVKALVVIHPKALARRRNTRSISSCCAAGKMIAFPIRRGARPAVARAVRRIEQLESRKAAQGMGAHVDSTKVVADVNYIANLSRDARPVLTSTRRVEQERRADRRKRQAAPRLCGRIQRHAGGRLKQTVLIHSSKIRSSSTR